MNYNELHVYQKKSSTESPNECMIYVPIGAHVHMFVTQLQVRSALIPTSRFCVCHRGILVNMEGGIKFG